MTNIRPRVPNGTYALARRLERRRLFHRMLARQDIKIESIHWSIAEKPIHRALHTCSHCGAKAACAAWIASGEHPASYVRFCPNSLTIETLRIMAA